MNSPRRLYNCDETFLPLDGTREKAVTLKKAKYAYAQAHGTSDHITMLCGASAAGIALPPMIIYPKSFPGGAYTFNDAVYAKSESGWVDSELFLSWMHKVFLEFAVPQRPVMLFVDGHKSHLSLELIDLARKNNVILFCLPPHTTHALQPLDVAVFKSFKDQFFKSVRALSFSKKNFIVSKRDFAAVVKDPFEKAFSMSNIKAGFSKAGIYPFNPNAIDPAKMKPSEFYRQQSNSSGSTNAETSSVLAPATPSPVVSSLDTTPCSSSSSVIPESSISISSGLSEDTIDVPCSSTQSPPLFSSTPVSSVCF